MNGYPRLTTAAAEAVGNIPCEAWPCCYDVGVATCTTVYDVGGRAAVAIPVATVVIAVTTTAIALGGC